MARKKWGEESAHTSFFKDASFPRYVGRRQELLPGRRNVVLDMPSAGMIGREYKPLSFSHVNNSRFGSAPLWTQLELLGTCAVGGQQNC